MPRPGEAILADNGAQGCQGFCFFPARIFRSVPPKMLDCASCPTPQVSSIFRYRSISRSNSSISPPKMSDPNTTFSNALTPDFGVCGLTTLDHQKIDLNT